MRESVLRRCSWVVGVSGLVLMAGCAVNVDREQTGSASAALSSSFVPTLGPADVLSPDSVWYQDVSTSPVASTSKAITDAMTFGHGHPMIDFSIKVMQVSSSTPMSTVQFAPDYTPDSDATPVPVPKGGALEDEAGYSCTQGGDCHLLVIDTGARKLFELWSVNNTSADGSGTWSAADETVWLMDGHYGPQGRGLGCTSADAAGLSVTAGLIGVREANAGVINHAIRFILPNSMIRKGKAFIAPATHGTSATSNATGAPYGAHLRLRASFNENSVATKGGVAVIRALKKYGMILADAGQDAFTAESDDLYRAEGLGWSGVLGASDLAGLTPSDFDVVNYDESQLGSGDDCARAADPATSPRGAVTPPSTGGTVTTPSTPPSTGGTVTPPSTGGTVTPPSTGGSTGTPSTGGTTGGTTGAPSTNVGTGAVIGDPSSAPSAGGSASHLVTEAPSPYGPAQPRAPFPASARAGAGVITP
jgi:hypothetical protein